MGVVLLLVVVVVVLVVVVLVVLAVVVVGNVVVVVGTVVVVVVGSVVVVRTVVVVVVLVVVVLGFFVVVVFRIGVNRFSDVTANVVVGNVGSCCGGCGGTISLTTGSMKMSFDKSLTKPPPAPEIRNIEMCQSRLLEVQARPI